MISRYDSQTTKKNALDGIFQTLRMAKQRDERRNKKEEIKVTSKHFNGLG